MFALDKCTHVLTAHIVALGLAQQWSQLLGLQSASNIQHNHTAASYIHCCTCTCLNISDTRHQ